MNSRLIKFRLWNNKGKYYVRDNDNKIASFDMLGIYNYFHSYNEHPNSFSFEQFTEILDKNGREICEGDIIYWNCGLKGSDFDPFIEILTEVKFKGGCFWANGELLYWHQNTCEIRGSIYENSNLPT